jgi:glycerophosphoryl diester phosphodiesterase
LRIALISAFLCLLCAPAAAVAAGGPEIHAHRGGSVVAGVPTFGEETMPAFRYAGGVERAVLELDVKLTSDRVPVVIHDDTLDRTTGCTGPVKGVTAAQFGACRVDVLGSGDHTARAPAGIPTVTLAELLAYARDSGARLNLEIKNLPNDNDFDPTGAYATTVTNAIKASGFPQDRLIVQSFYPPNLDVAATELPGAELSYLTLAATPADVSFAKSRGYDWVSPSGVPTADYVAGAHAAGVRVAPYTLDTAADVRAGAANGVDAVITNDPVLARRALGRPDPPGPAARRAKVGVRVLTRRLRNARRYGTVRVRVTTDLPLARLNLAVRRGKKRIGRITRTGLRKRTRVISIKVARRRLGGRSARLAVTASGGLKSVRATVRLR